MAVGLSVEEGRIGKKRGGYGLQCQRDAQFLHHVSLGREIEVDLHGAGAAHHGLAHSADLLHVGVHELVAALGHHRHVFVPPDRCRSKADEADTDLVGDVLDLGQVDVHLIAGVVDGLDRGTGEFKLAAGFKRHVGAVLFEANEFVPFHDRGPAVLVTQAFQNGAHAAVAVIGDGLERVLAVAELLVLGADAPVVAWFAAAFEIACQLGL